MKIFGIEFCPIHVPLERRLQTLATAAWMVTLAFGGFIGLIFSIYLVLCTRLWWLTLLYFVWVFFDKDRGEQGGRPIRWVRSWAWWKYFRDYFPLHLEKLPFVELDPKKNYLFCCFPHGILSSGAFNAFGSEHSEYRGYFPYHEPHVVTLSQHYHMPLFRELAMALGGISSSARSIDYVLSRAGGGHVCVVMVGGAAEAYYCKPGNYSIILKRRKGFVRLALKNGTPLVPVLSFGETDLFDQMDGDILRKFQEKLREWIGIAPILPIGRGFFQYSFGIIPRRSRVTTVVGKPIDVPQVENPPPDLIEKYHQLFTEQLEKMFEEQKYNYLENPEEKKLVIN